jgi:hypothetical protein
MFAKTIISAYAKHNQAANAKVVEILDGKFSIAARQEERGSYYGNLEGLAKHIALYSTESNTSLSGFGLAADSAGNVYAAGHFQGKATVSYGGHEVTGKSNGPNILLIKYREE